MLAVPPSFAVKRNRDVAVGVMPAARNAARSKRA